MRQVRHRFVRVGLVTLFVTVPGYLLIVGDRAVVIGGAVRASCSVSLASGGVQGLDLGQSCAFLGIPYAASTAGDNRWKPPQPAPAWAPGILNATSPPPNCPLIGGTGGNENCLMLNVWVGNPAPSTPAPVIVWLHTGAFVAASANFPGTNGRRLAEETGVIVVAPNYRLGPFGFLVHSALAGESVDGTSGNYGLLDQRAALRWVQDNIAAFGGNPGNVTLAGTSAGGQSTGLHLVSPGSAGLFHRAVVQSAYPTSRWNTAAESEAQGQALAAALGCLDPGTVLACLRSKSRAEVLAALAVAAQQVSEPVGAVFWEPVVDGVVIPEQPRALFERGAFHQVPTIVGFTRDEGWGNFITRSFPSGPSLAAYHTWVETEFGDVAARVLALYPADEDPGPELPSPIEAMARVTGDAQFVCEAVRLARAIERTRTPTFVYSYEHEIPTLSVGHVIHGVETHVLFGNNYTPPQFAAHALDATDLALHAAMAGYWTRFAASGSPNTDDESVVRWPAFRHPAGEGRGADKYLILDPPIREGMRPREAPCRLFEPLFLRSLLGAVPAAAQ